MGVRIVLAENEPIGEALRRFKKVVRQDCLTYNLRRQVAFYNANQKRRAKAYKKRIQARRATLQAKMAGEQPVASLAAAFRAFRKKTGKP